MTGLGISAGKPPGGFALFGSCPLYHRQAGVRTASALAWPGRNEPENFRIAPAHRAGKRYSPHRTVHARRCPPAAKIITIDRAASARVMTELSCTHQPARQNRSCRKTDSSGKTHHKINNPPGQQRQNSRNTVRCFPIKQNPPSPSD